MKKTTILTALVLFAALAAAPAIASIAPPQPAPVQLAKGHSHKHKNAQLPDVQLAKRAAAQPKGGHGKGARA